jgi:hypothetical protein
MPGIIEKGRITSINHTTYTAKVLTATGIVSNDIVIPYYLSTGINKGTEVVFVIFDDRTGIILARADGNGSPTSGS